MSHRDPAAAFGPARITGLMAAFALSFAWAAAGAADPPRNVARPATRPAAAPAKPATAAKPTAPSATPQVMAVVNGEPISREDLARQCLARYGEEVLEGMVNRQLIVTECQRRKIAVTDAEVQAEIERMAQRFGLSLEHWFKLLQEERNISPEQYARDIVWPTLALRKLAGERLAITPEELQREFETQFGEAVSARIIVLANKAAADAVRQQAAAQPAEFANLAKKHSVDSHTASIGGVIPPIRRHVGYEIIEKTAFALKDGEVSAVIPVGSQFIVLKREKLIPARHEKPELVQKQLEQAISDEKLKQVADEVFSQLQKTAKVENVLNQPNPKPEHAGVAALINGQPLPLRQLAEECIARHGEEVLDAMINRKLVEQACKKQKIAVTEADVEAEIAHLASLMLPAKKDGSPDVEGWIKMVCAEQQMDERTYRQDAVWPAVALKKLTGKGIEVSDEDLQKGFEANYGPRVRCKAIVLNNVRLAQQVWEMARDNPSPDYFGDLAAQYSVEAGSRTLRGEVPPIQRHGGQPILEEEAFTLKAGELSEVIQVGDKYVILLCEGYTEPTKVPFAEVRDLLYEDILEKKQQVAMVGYFQKLSDGATVDNYLAGESRTPQAARVGAKTAVPKLQEVTPRR